MFFEDFGEQCDRFMIKIQNDKHLASICFRDQIEGMVPEAKIDTYPLGYWWLETSTKYATFFI